MDDIFANAKNILIVCTSDTDKDNLPDFQQIIQKKSGEAQLVVENLKVLSESRRATSSFDIILFDLINKKDTFINLDLVNELFRLLRPNGYVLTHMAHTDQTQIINNFKMCGFTSCNPLDANSSFLIKNKSDEIKKLGSLWLCQKPSFDVGYSVPLRRTGVSLLRQISTTGGGRKTWTVEHDDDDDSINTNSSFGFDNQQNPDVKSYDRVTTSSSAQLAFGNNTSGSTQQTEKGDHASALKNLQSSSGNRNTDDISPSRSSPSFKPSEHVFVPSMSDV